jgi:hypothetical protein
MTVYEREQRNYAPYIVKEKIVNKPGKVVGYISLRHRVAWTVSPHREDQRHGATTRKPMSEYCQAMCKAVSVK